MNRTNNLSVLPAVFTLLILTLGLSFNANNDMGRIYVSNEAVKVSEDAQKAIILHNLEEEVLILGTDLKADKKIGIIRFIPFPSEPKVSLAPDNAFEKASAMIKKYGLKYQYFHYTKGGPATSTSEGVELRFNKKLGAHDLTIIKVNDVSTFRQWVNNFFKSKGLPVKEKYPEEEAIVDDYVKRGIIYFVLDFVEVLDETRFIEPVTYKFKSKALYYPLKTSNTFGGEGSIELIIMAPTTLCAPGNELFNPYSGALYKEENPGSRRPYNQRPLCLNIPVKASTSALIVKEEKDIEEIYPEGESFFKDQKAFIQVIRYEGKYFFEDDIFVDVSTGFSREVGAFEEERSNPFLSGLEKLSDELFQKKKKCSLKSERGPCKGNFKRYYYDSLSNKCKEFIWGGCGGVVPFETKEECEKCKNNDELKGLARNNVETKPERMGINGGYFTCSLPTDWEREKDELKKGDKTYQVVFLGPRAENAPVMIFVSYFGPGNDYFADYADFVTRNTTDLLEDKPIAEARKITINGNKALWFEREAKTYLHPESKSDESVVIKEKFYVLLAKDRKGFFVIHYSAPKSVYDQHLPVFERIANSFKLL